MKQVDVTQLRMAANTAGSVILEGLTWFGAVLFLSLSTGLSYIANKLELKHKELMGQRQAQGLDAKCAPEPQSEGVDTVTENS